MGVDDIVFAGIVLTVVTAILGSIAYFDRFPVRGTTKDTPAKKATSEGTAGKKPKRKAKLTIFGIPVKK